MRDRLMDGIMQVEKRYGVFILEAALGNGIVSALCLCFHQIPLSGSALIVA